MNQQTQTEEASLTLRVPGDLISTSAEALNQEADVLFEKAGETPQKWNSFVLDLSSARMIDSVGLNLVATLLKRAHKCGAKMQVAYTSPNILRTFTFTRLNKHVELVKV